MAAILSLAACVVAICFLLPGVSSGLLNPIFRAAHRRLTKWDKFSQNLTAWCRSIASDVNYNMLAPAGDLTEQLRIVRASPVAACVTGAMGGVGRELVRRLTNHSVLQNRTMLSAWTRPEKLLALKEKFPHVRAVGVNLAVGNGTSTAINNLLAHVLDGAQATASGCASLDLLVHNAGLMAKNASLRDTFAVNFYSPMFLSIAMLPHMLAGSKTPLMLFVGSSSHLRGAPLPSPLPPVEASRLMGYQGAPHRIAVAGAYADAKLRLLLAATALERRFGPAGLTVRTAHPGLVDTPMLRGYFGEALARGWRNLKLLRSEEEGAAAVLLPALTHFDVIRWAPLQTATTPAAAAVTRDYRRSYHVNGRSAPGKCSSLVNDAAACEACLQDVVHEIRVTATAATRGRLIALLKDAAPLIDSNADLPDEIKSRRKAALAALGRDLEE